MGLDVVVCVRSSLAYISCISAHFGLAVTCLWTAHALDEYCVGALFLLRVILDPFQDEVYVYICSAPREQLVLELYVASRPTGSAVDYCKLRQF